MKWVLSYTAVGMQIGEFCMEVILAIPAKLDMDLLFLDQLQKQTVKRNGCSKKTKTLIRKDTCTSMFTAALFTIAKIQKQPKCPSTDEWVKKTVEYYSAIKKRTKFCHLQQHGWTWRALC